MSKPEKIEVGQRWRLHLPGTKPIDVEVTRVHPVGGYNLATIRAGASALTVISVEGLLAGGTFLPAE